MKTTSNTQRAAHKPPHPRNDDVGVRVCRDVQVLSLISLLADAAIRKAEESYNSRPLHAAITTAVALREIAAWLPKENRPCRNRK